MQLLLHSVPWTTQSLQPLPLRALRLLRDSLPTRRHQSGIRHLSQSPSLGVEQALCCRLRPGMDLRPLRDARPAPRRPALVLQHLRLRCVSHLSSQARHTTLNRPFLSSSSLLRSRSRRSHPELFFLLHIRSTSLIIFSFAFAFNFISTFPLISFFFVVIIGRRDLTIGDQLNVRWTGASSDSHC